MCHNSYLHVSPPPFAGVRAASQSVALFHICMHGCRIPVNLAGSFTYPWPIVPHSGGTGQEKPPVHLSFIWAVRITCCVVRVEYWPCLVLAFFILALVARWMLSLASALYPCPNCSNSGSFSPPATTPRVHGVRCNRLGDTLKPLSPSVCPPAVVCVSTLCLGSVFSADIWPLCLCHGLSMHSICSPS